MTPLRTPLMLLLGIACLATSWSARAGHVTELTSAFDKGNPYDFNLKVQYTRRLSRGAISRERDRAVGAVEPDAVQTVKDLRYSQLRHILSLRAEAALFRDLQLHIELPIVLSDTRNVDLAQNGGDSCGLDSVNCVTRRSSTFVQDGFVPGLEGVMSDNQVPVAGEEGGYDPRTGQTSGGQPFLNLPVRSGLDQLYLGLTWAPINQRRDYTKPTWLIGFEARIAVGTPMEFNPYFDPDPRLRGSPKNPEGNASVGRGLHEFHFYTAVSKRYRYLEPWVSFDYLLPVATSQSLFKRTDFPATGQERSAPVQHGSAEAGLEVIPWEQPEKRNKFTIELRAKVEGVFEGRDYTPAWELLANSPILRGPCRFSNNSSAPSLYDNGTYCRSAPGSPPAADDFIPYPGITSVENHAIFTETLAFNLDLTRWLRARMGLALGHEMQHYITFADAGKDLNGSGNIEQEIEANPLYRPYIDQVGRRFRVSESTIFDFFVSLMGQF